MTQQEYFDVMNDLTAHPGWKVIEEDSQQAIAAFQVAIEQATDLRQLGVIQGRIGQLRHLIGLRDALLTGEREWKAQEAEAKEQRDA